MYIPKARNLIKFDQKSREDIQNSLLPRHELSEELSLGDTITYNYRYDKVKVSGKAVIIGINKTHCGTKLVLCGENSSILRFLYNPKVIDITVIKKSNKRIRRAKLNYLVKVKK